MLPTSLRPSSRSAFTLIEMMVVMLLLGILGAAIIPEMRGTFQDALLRSSARELVNTLQVAASRSVSLNAVHRVRLDPSSRRFRVERRSKEARGAEVFAPLKDVFGGAGQLDPRIQMRVQAVEQIPAANSDADQAGAGATGGGEPGEREENPDDIRFYPDGTAEARDIILRDQQGFGLALRINPTTARVRVSELERQ